MDTSKSELNPWRIICGHLFEIDSYSIPEIIDKAGMSVNWSLTERENYSHKYRKDAFRTRINASYESLSEEDQLRVVYSVASELANRGFSEALNVDLKKIGWQVEDDRLVPVGADVRELFFPIDAQHDAYVEIRGILQKATSSITIIDPYLDSSVLTLLGTVSSQALDIRLLTYKLPADFIQEKNKFLSQHKNFTLDIRKSREFHDRFIIIDDDCWHVGCSLKDAGSRVFMLSKIEDMTIRTALINQLKSTWKSANSVV